MVGSSEVRILCPSVSFFFTRLGASLGVSLTFFPLVEGFVFGGSSLSVVLASLFPLLHQSVDWFKELVGEQRVMSKVRSSELETGLSSSDDPAEVEEDTAASSPREVKAWTLKSSLDLGICFSFPRGLRFIVLIKRNEPTTFHLGRCTSTKLLSSAGLGFPSTHSLWSFLVISTLLLGNLCQTHGG